MKLKFLFRPCSLPVLLLFACSVYAGNPGHTIYQVINLGNPLGGALSQGTSNNQPGQVLGFSTFPSTYIMHAELWRDNSAIDLGTLGGPNSAVAWPNRNNNGVIAGISETTEIQPLGEQWSCYLAVFYYGDGHVCRGFVWQHGAMTALPTLGGDNGFATGVNNSGQIVGWAENTTHDPTCGEYTNNNQVLQFEAVTWTQRNGHYHASELPPYPGDLDGAATAINQEGQVVGITGICDGAIGGATAEHMVMWRNGKVVRELPTLGGAYWNTPMDINNRGNVVGFSDLPGDGPTGGGANFHAFYWSRKPFNCSGTRITGTCDLGVLAGDFVSEALGVNDRGQVVGVSYPSGHAFIWQNGVMTDLNNLLAPSTTLVLTDGQDINDQGEITGQAYDSNTGASVAFKAIPTDTGH
ncbi:MAG: hypothetical protein WBR29_12930 [Gammaproteobacteria bacterium]